MPLFRMHKSWFTKDSAEVISQNVSDVNILRLGLMPNGRNNGFRQADRNGFSVDSF